MAFSQPLSGIAAQSKNLDVIGNNIANSQTVGFKSGNALFADVFAGANSKVGLGTRISDVRQDFSAGDLESTGRGLDLAIGGEGFFQLEESNGETVYSRNGQFSQDSEGFLVNATGQKLTGYGLSDSEDPFSDIQESKIEPLQISREDVPANATEEASTVYNLDARAVPGEDLQEAEVLTDPDDETSGTDIEYHFSASFTAYDSLGNDHTVTQYFERVDKDPNDWVVRHALDGVRVPGGGNNKRISFDSNGELRNDSKDLEDGALKVQDGGGDERLKFNADDYDFEGAEDLAISFDFKGTTQFNNSSTQNSLTQDGHTSGSLAGIEVENDGTVQRNFTNGESRAAGRVTLASFVNQEGLQPQGDNNFSATNASGEPAIGTAGAGLLGSIESGAVENSNVDLASELVDTIIAQRAYQANSTSISTQDELLQTVIQL